MRRTWTAAAAATGALALACNGHYEVGVMDMPGASPSSSAGKSTGGAEMVMIMKGLGGNSSGDSELGPQCVPAGLPAPLEGELAAPDVVWARLSPVIWDEVAAPPFALPAATTPDWADDVAGKALDQARAEQGAVPGAVAFLRDWLRYPADAELSLSWGMALSSEGSALHALLSTPQPDTKRVGVFAEQAWLAAYPAIATRGFIMLQALFGQYMPPEPNGLDTDIAPAPGFSRREQLAANVADPSCAACHSRVDPLGVSLEHFDGDGQYRELDAGRPVDASGNYQLLASARTIQFDDIADLGSQLEDSCDANVGLASEFMRLALARSDPAYEAAQPVSGAYEADRARMQQGFIRGGRSYRALVRAFAQSAAVLRP